MLSCYILSITYTKDSVYNRVNEAQVINFSDYIPDSLLFAAVPITKKTQSSTNMVPFYLIGTVKGHGKSRA